jgi:hypothetical protein
MSDSGQFDPSIVKRRRMNARALIWTAFPRKPAAHLQSITGCTERQARRMVATGWIPRRFLEGTLDAIEHYLAARRVELEQAASALREIDYEIMGSRSANRMAALQDARRDPAPRLAAGAENSQTLSENRS